MGDVTPVEPAHTKESTLSPIEWFGAMYGALLALDAAEAGMDLAVLRADLRAWETEHLDGSDRFATSDWPGWQILGLGRFPARTDDEPAKPKPPPRPPRAALIDLLSGPATSKGQWVVYRHFDRHGLLLYVGITSDLRARHRAHRAQTLWWTEIERITVELVPDYESARALELVAIATEDPEWNTANRA